MRLFKRLACGLLVCMVAFTLTGCELVSVNTEKDNNQVVIILNGKEYLKKDVNAMIDSQLTNYGIDPNDKKNADEIAGYKEQLFQDYAKLLVVRAEAVSKGYLEKLSEAELADIDKKYQEVYDTLMVKNVETYNEEYKDETNKAELVEKAKNDAINEFLVYADIKSIEEYKETLKIDKAVEIMKTEIGNEATVTEEQIVDSYDTFMLEQEATFAADPKAYSTAITEGTPIVFTPAGMRRVKQVLIPIDDATKTEIAALRQQEAQVRETADTNKANELLAQITQKRTDALKKIEATANEALGKVATTPFDQIIKDFGKDPGSTGESDTAKNGYIVSAGTASQYVTEFQKAAMELAKVGSTSGLVASDYGYHILNYASDIPSAKLTLDQARPAINEYVLKSEKTNLIDARISELVDQYVKENKLVKYSDRMPIVVIPGK